MTKNKSNTFAGAAIALCMTEEELKKRLDAYLELSTIKVERDRAIESAYSEHNRLHDFAKAVVYGLKSIEKEDGKLSKSRLKLLLAHARNITIVENELEVPEIYKNNGDSVSDTESKPQ